MTLAPPPPMSRNNIHPLESEAGMEFVGGRIVEKPASMESSRIGATINRLLGNEAAKSKSADVFERVAYPNTRSVSVYRADGTTALLHEEDEITGESALPGFRCKVGEFFAASTRRS